MLTSLMSGVSNFVREYGEDKKVIYHGSDQDMSLPISYNGPAVYHWAQIVIFLSQGFQWPFQNSRQHFSRLGK